MESFKGKANVVCADQEVICVNISTVIGGFCWGSFQDHQRKTKPREHLKDPTREVQNFSVFGVLCVIMHFNVFFYSVLKSLLAI